MARLIYVESSPRKMRSKSIRVAEAFLNRYSEKHSNDEIIKIDLWNKELPEFDGYTIDAKYQVMHGQGFDSSQAEAWRRVVELCDEFKAGDKYLISLPMWNFSIPYKLKHYIDVITQPGQMFTFSPESGYEGLVTGKPVVVVYARGGAYGSDQSKGMDMQSAYMQLWLGFVGFTDIQSIKIEPTLGGVEEVEATEKAAIELARKIATTF